MIFLVVEGSNHVHPLLLLSPPPIQVLMLLSSFVKSRREGRRGSDQLNSPTAPLFFGEKRYRDSASCVTRWFGRTEGHNTIAREEKRKTSYGFTHLFKRRKKKRREGPKHLPILFTMKKAIPPAPPLQKPQPESPSPPSSSFYFVSRREDDDDSLGFPFPPISSLIRRPY